jgi:hypothetical protein
MEFRVQQRYPTPAEAVLAVYADPDFYRDLGGGERIGPPEVLDRSQEGHVVTLRIRYRFTADLPDAAGRFVDKDKLTWIEHTEYDLSALIARSNLTADHYDTLLTASATHTYRDDRPDDGSVRHIDGQVDVAVPLLGGKVERAIIEGLEEHLDAERAAAISRLAGG